MMNILIAEDHPVVSTGLKMLLERNADMKVLAEATTGKQALDILASDHEVDILLSDLTMPQMDGIDLTRRVRGLTKPIKIVLLSMHDQQSHVFDAFQAGADAFLLKTASIEEIIFALKHVYLGQRYISSSLGIELMEKNLEKQLQMDHCLNSTMQLSSRELEVLHLLANGLTNQEISDKLFLSKRTVEGHRQSLIEKFGAHNSAQLIWLSTRAGLLN